MRQSIRGYADAVLEDASAEGALQTTAAEMAGVRDVVVGSDDLSATLLDPGVPVAARRAVVTDLFEPRVGAPTIKLLTYLLDQGRATEFAGDLSWLVTRTEAAAQNRTAEEVLLGRVAARERVDGYATAVVRAVERDRLGEVEDELFRFMRTVGGSPELRAALTSRDVPTQARRGIVEELLSSKATAATTRLAAYATQVGRPRDYEELLEYLVEHVAAETNRRVADVQVPVELDEEQRRHLSAALGRIAGHDVDVRVIIDPSVLAGFVATIGDTVVDGSARHQLTVLKERLRQPEATNTTGDSR